MRDGGPAPAGGALQRARWSAERRARAAWREGPGAPLRAAAAAWAAGALARGLLYDAGVLRARRAPVPVVSVGGLTVGGSGKTPLTAGIAGWLADERLRVGVVAAEGDEAEVHGILEPRARVESSRDRLAAVCRLAAAGCRVVVLDSGFQHRRLARDLDVVALDPETLLRGRRHCLPAGPFREGPGALRRAGAAVVVRREADATARDAILAELRARFPALPLSACRLRPGAATAANEEARRAGRPDPGLAVAGLMEPEVFLRQARARFPGLVESVALPDHYPYPEEAVLRLVERAGPGGIVCTLKDAVKLRLRVGHAAPLWYLEDRLEWETGREELRRLVLRVAGPPAGTERGAREGQGTPCGW